MCRIVCLVREYAPLIYFVNRLHHAKGVSLVVVEERPSRQLTLKEQSICNKWFGTEWMDICSAIPCIHTHDINSIGARTVLREEHPDVIVDHGTSIVCPDIIESASIALNLHWGLSPYYRGVFCTEWALINRDPHNIGVSIHLLSREIDGGPIVAQQRANICGGMSVFDINMQLTSLGTELTVRTVEKWTQSGNVQTILKDVNDGFLYRAKDMNQLLLEKVAVIERTPGMLDEMLRRPSRDPCPIVELHA